MANLEKKSQSLLKLDFNERSDSLPYWISDFELSLGDCWKYPDKSELEQLISQKYQLQLDELLVTNGGDEAIELMFKWAKLNDYKVILPLPAFSQYWLGVDTWQLNTVTLEPLSSLKIDQDAILNSIENNSIVVITSPNNPTGETLLPAELETICIKAQSKGAFVFLDCAYIEFTNLENDYLELLKRYDNLLMLRTLSKAYGLASARVGYLLGNNKILKNIINIAMPFNVSKFNIQLAKLAFTEKAESEVREYCEKIEVNRKQLVSYLSKFKLSINESFGNFVFIRGEKNVLKLISAACNQFNTQIKTNLVGLSKEKDINAIRVGIPLSLERLIKAFKLALEPELICFDMDGVLIDTSKSYDESILKTVEYFCKTKLKTTDIESVRAKGGFNNDWVLTQELIKQQGFDIDIENVKSIFQTFYLGTNKEKGLFNLEKPFLSESFSELVFIKKSKSLATAVVTGRNRSEAQQGLNQLSIRNTLLVSDDDVANSKPDAEGINKAKDFYKSDLTWMLGDTPDDMMAANAAGAIAIGIGGDNLYDFGADLVLSNVNELEVLL